MTRRWVHCALVVICAPTLLAIGCPKSEPMITYTVSERLPRGTGVTLVVENSHGRKRNHDYRTSQAGCHVGAEWPTCIRPEYP